MGNHRRIEEENNGTSGETNTEKGARAKQEQGPAGATRGNVHQKKNARNLKSHVAQKVKTQGSLKKKAENIK